MKKFTLPFTSGIRYMLLSTLSFAVMNVFIKKVSNVPAMEVVFFRCLVSMLLCLIIIYQDKADWKGSNRKLLLARGIFGTIALYTFFITLQNIPLGTAVTIQYLSPIFTTVIAIFWLREKVKPLQWLFFALSFAGVLVIKGFDNRISLTMLAIGIVSALASGFAYNMVRSLKEKEHTMVVVLHFQLVGVATGLVGMLFNWRMPNGWEWFYLIMIGVCTQLGQVNLTKALQSETMANVTIFNYVGIIYALGFGFLLFGEHYEGLAFAGIALVLTGVLLNYFYQRKQNKITPEEELTTVEE
ncbi:MAG TPA: DMT family transporter [Chitinophagales bacterium]|nr:DMT family transporter [Chitinophagales bacterium]